MKIIICFVYLLNLVSSLNCADRNARNFLVDFINNLLPGRHANQASCECGLNGQRTGRIVNGSDAMPYSQPWQAILIFESTKQQFCSATLINSRWLVTAYHCLMEQTTTSMSVILGTNRINEKYVAKVSNNGKMANQPDFLLQIREHKRSVLKSIYRLDESGNKTFVYETIRLSPFSLDDVQIFGIKRFVLNKKFEDSWFKNDIALIELDRDVRISDAIRPICLFNSTEYLDQFQSETTGTVAQITDVQNKKSDSGVVGTEFEREERWLSRYKFEAYGFGRIGYNQVGSAKLKKVTFRYEKLNTCKEIWESKLTFFGGLIDESQMCAYNEYSTICHGDSGTGLILPLNSTSRTINGTKSSNQKMKNYLVGVASAGYYCQKDVPSLFTRLSSNLKFINSNVNSGYWCSK